MFEAKAMTEQAFRQFLSHRAVNYVYKDAGLAGLISIWPHEGMFVLTWEECDDGDQYNEHGYTRDEVQHFRDLDAVVAYLHGCDVEPERFEL